MKNEAPTESGTVPTIGGFEFPYPADGNPDGSSTSAGQVYYQGSVESYKDFILNHRGYLFAPQSGTYIFNATRIDDVLYVWAGTPGSAAYTGWNKGNKNLFGVYDTNGPGNSTSTFQMTAGKYYAFRAVLGQAGYSAGYQFSVTAPDGTTFITSDSVNTPYVVQFSCDGTTAPQYPAFGKET